MARENLYKILEYSLWSPLSNKPLTEPVSTLIAGAIWRQ